MSVIFNTAVVEESGGTASFTISGLPAGWRWTVADEPIEISTNDKEPTWHWQLGYTDGGTIGNLENGEWDIVWRTVLSGNSGIDNWIFLSSDGANVTEVELDFSLGQVVTNGYSSLTVSRIEETSSNTVPEPSVFMLTGFGLLSMAGMLRKKR